MKNLHFLSLKYAVYTWERLLINSWWVYFVVDLSLVLHQPSTALLAKTKADIAKKSSDCYSSRCFRSWENILIQCAALMDWRRPRPQLNLEGWRTVPIGNRTGHANLRAIIKLWEKWKQATLLLWQAAPPPLWAAAETSSTNSENLNNPCCCFFTLLLTMGSDLIKHFEIRMVPNWSYLLPITKSGNSNSWIGYSSHWSMSSSLKHRKCKKWL